LNLNKEDESSSSSTAMQTTGSHVSSGQATLQRECGNSGHILALYIKTRGDFVLVGDLLRSMSLLQYKQAENTLEEVARDYNSNYMRAIETMGDDDHFLGSDDHGNLFCMRRQADATADEDRSKMEPQGEFSLGDHVNVFRRGSLNSQPADQDVSAASGQAASSGSSSAAAAGLTANIAGSNSPSSLLFGTVNGAIGTVMTLSYESFVFFSTLERAIKTLVPAVGGFSHDDFRSFSNDRRCTPQRNMVDGDLVESLLDLDRAQMEQIVRHMNDEIAAASNTSTVGTGLSSAATTASTIHSVLSGEKSTNQLTVEEVVRRVEDMARLH
jgi:DNA damage-binding protein 1